MSLPIKIHHWLDVEMSRPCNVGTREGIATEFHTYVHGINATYQRLADVQNPSYQCKIKSTVMNNNHLNVENQTRI